MRIGNGILINQAVVGQIEHACTSADEGNDADAVGAAVGVHPQRATVDGDSACIANDGHREFAVASLDDRLVGRAEGTRDTQPRRSGDVKVGGCAKGKRGGNRVLAADNRDRGRCRVAGDGQCVAAGDGVGARAVERELLQANGRIKRHRARRVASHAAECGDGVDGVGNGVGRPVGGAGPVASSGVIPLKAGGGVVQGKELIAGDVVKIDQADMADRVGSAVGVGLGDEGSECIAAEVTLRGGEAWQELVGPVIV